jgi:hypothetical protein
MSAVAFRDKNKDYKFIIMWINGLVLCTILIYRPLIYYNFACDSVWVWKLVSDIKEGT